MPALVSAERAERVASRRDAAFRRALALADVLGAALAIAVAHRLAVDGDMFLALFAGLPLVVLLSKAIGLYDRDGLVLAARTLDEAPQLFHLSSLYTLVITVLAGPMSGGTLRASTIVMLWALLFLGLLAARGLARQLARGATPEERCLVLGSEPLAAAVQAKFDHQDGLHSRIVAHLSFGEFELRRKREAADANGRSKSGTFADYIAMRDIQRVIIAPGESHRDVLETVRYFKDSFLKVSVLPSLLDAVGSSVEFDDVHGTTLLGIPTLGLSRSSMHLKRSFDVLGSTVLLTILSPLIAVIAIAIKLDSQGPVLFTQTRIGRKDRPFTLLKFRTMHAGADELRGDLAEANETAGLFKVAHDPRVTAVGRWLRRTSLDELPQLVNVLRGEMSLVGPRPLVVEEDARVEGWHRHRLLIKPGMTGAWQIMGHTRVPLEQMAVMDYLYIVNWSLWNDTKILLRTARHVLGRRGL